MKFRHSRKWKFYGIVFIVILIVMLTCFKDEINFFEPQSINSWIKYSDPTKADFLGQSSRINLQDQYHRKAAGNSQTKLLLNDSLQMDTKFRSGVQFKQTDFESRRKVTDKQLKNEELLLVPIQKLNFTDISSNKSRLYHHNTMSKKLKSNHDMHLNAFIYELSKGEREEYKKENAAIISGTHKTGLKSQENYFKKLFQEEENVKYYNQVKSDAEKLNLTMEAFLKITGILDIPKESMTYIWKRIKLGQNSYIRPAKGKTIFSDHNLNITKPIRQVFWKEVWQIQGGDLHIFLYSAFYDDRPALSVPHVRVISVAEIEVENIVCLLWHWNRSYPDISKATKIQIGPRISPLMQRRYESYIFSCELFPNRDYKPEYVSIITSSQTVPTNLIKIHYPEKLQPEERLDFGHCMSIIYWDHSPYRIVEWMELHKLWGIGEFNVYTNSLNENIKTIFEYYANEGYLNLYELPSVLDDDAEWTILMNMSPAINDCMYRNMYRYKRVVCTDTDEMIVPIMHGNYPAMITAIHQRQNITHSHPSYLFRNVYFFNDFGPVYKYPVILHTQRYLRHIKPSVFGYSAKSITDPQACVGLQNHLCWKRVDKYDGLGWLVDVRMQFGMNFHYKKCHFDEYLEKEGECAKMMKNNTEDHTMRQFKRELYPRVRGVLQDLGLF